MCIETVSSQTRNVQIRGETRRNLPSFYCDNADWLGDVSYLNFLRDVGTCFTISRMLSFDSVKSRLDRQQGLSFLEFNYMLMQAYDFWYLFKNHGCIAQFGGSDQWGNMIPGVDLIKHHHKKTAFCITCPLLTKSDGTKMGKTAGGLTLWLDPDMMSPYDFWQYWRNVDDADVERFLKMLTFMELDEISQLMESADFNKAKIVLADLLTTYVHGDQVLSPIHQTVDVIFGQHAGSGLRAEELLQLYLPHFHISPEWIQQKLPLPQVLTLLKITKSNSEARNLIKQGGLSIDGHKILSDQEFSWENLPQPVSLIKMGAKSYGVMILGSMSDGASCR